MNTLFMVKRMTKIKRHLTNSRIDNCLTLYSILKELYDENDTDLLDYDFCFKEIMKRSRGSLNPMFIKLELEKI